MAFVVSSVHTKAYVCRNAMATFSHALCIYGIPDFGTIDMHIVDVSGSNTLGFYCVYGESLVYKGLSDMHSLNQA